MVNVRTAKAQAIKGTYLGINWVMQAQTIPKNRAIKNPYFKVCLKPLQSHGSEIDGFFKYKSLWWGSKGKQIRYIV